MSSINLATSIHICEDTEGNFDVRDILAAAGYTSSASINVSAMYVVLPDGTTSTQNTALFGKVDADTIYVRPGQWHADYNGQFTTVEFVVDQGAGNTVTMTMQVIVDPVNDAPTAANKTFNLNNGNAVVLSQGDFGFVDAVEHDAFQSVIVTSLPTAGKLLLNGVAIAAGAEVSAADIAAGKLAFEPSQSASGSFDIGFKVRDAGGLVGCNAADTSATPNYLTFKVPPAHLGDFVWEDGNGNGVQDAGEAGIGNVVVELKDGAGKVVASTTTDAAGQYHFDVDAGTYSVSVKAPAGFKPVGQDLGGNDATDSDIDAAGNTGPIALTPGETNNKADAGLYRPASLGDTVWYDTNRNGTQDAGESGVAGVRVTLLDANGSPVGATVTTDANGHYQFSDLKPGSYSVQFDQTSLPAHHLFTAQGQGGDATVDSNADATTGRTAPVTLASGESNQTVDAGIVAERATLGDRVWEDSNGNGVQDAGEAGLVGVNVELRDANGNLVATTTTGADGNYSFTVDAGQYKVAVTAPAGMTVTAQNAGGNAAADSDIDATGQSGLVTLTPGQVDNTIDAGLYRAASLGDRVWLDANRNGVQDAGEAGVAGVKVTLLDASGNPVGASATTDANGGYSFTNLKPGTYSVQFDKATLPAGHTFTAADQGGNDAADSDANAGTGATAQVTLVSGANNADLDAGVVVVQAKLGDTVWEDKNANGVQDSGEAGIASVTVELKDASGKVVQTTSTDAGGRYNFTADPGSYTVSVKAPAGYVFTGKDAGADDAKDSDVGATGQSDTVVLKAGDVNNTIDAGLYKNASVGDRVWLDSNKNGVQDSGEAGVCNVKVSLFGADGKQVGASVLTDASGNYQFSNLKPGSYSVVFDKASLPEGMAFTSANQGGNDATDSDVNAAGQSHTFTLTSGQVDKTVDAGVLAAATIGDRVWIDNNGNGLQDSGEAGKSGVTVELRDTAGKVVKTTTTDNSGNYKFSVEAGTYSVAIKTPTGYTVTTQDVGANNDIDSDANASGNLGSVTVAAGQNVTNMDAGLYQKGSIGDKVWFDTNGDGIQQSGEAGAKGVAVTLFNEKNVAVGTTTTDASGLYSFNDLGPGKYSVKFAAVDGYLFTKQNQGGSDSLDSDVDSTGKSAQITLASGVNDKTHDAGLVKAASIGDTVWEDANYNGVQDTGEKGVDGVTVKLYDGNNVLKQTVVTANGGKYLFDGLQAGGYKVEVVKGSGWFFTKADVGDYTKDSDVTSVSGNSGRTDTIDLATGEQLRTVDAGIYRKASIGDKVWRDGNHNGVQDSGEEGIGGISVSLYDTANNKLGTVKTDSNGNYKFADLTPGNYYLVFDKSNVIFKNYNMNDWKWGVKNTGSNDAIDSDVNGDMVSKVNVTKTDTINLSSGENDMSWDAGITPIAIDLNGDGIHTIARADMQGSFDLLGTGKAIQSGWLSKGDGFLAVDSNGNGSIDSISELFGGTAKGSGFAKLASYDSNGDGVVNASDAQFGSLLIWQDANSNGKTDAGELVSLKAAGVASLNVGYTELPFLDANNNLHLERSSVTMSNGKTADMTDVYFNVAAADAAAAGVTLPTMADLLADGTQPVQLVAQCHAQLAYV
jgi:protocatechuate 3,4-dioxygenase beta subunit